MTEQNLSQQNFGKCSLYSLLESANLLDYYDRFLDKGGDDVDQFCEATEHEFKEITKLVGMHTKPLHIRRLQKALVEFWTAKKKTGGKLRPSLGRSWMETWNTGESSPTTTGITLTKPTTTSITITSMTNAVCNGTSSASLRRGRPSKGEKRVKSGVFELKLPSMEAIIDWERLDEERKQLIREHSRIYGRDTKKRKSVDLNSHEQIINEAAAQLCLRDPTLLVRRDELFTQARRIVRDSGFSFVHGHSRSKFASMASTDSVPHTDVLRSTSKTNRHERLQKVDETVEKLKERIDLLMQKKRELEATSQVTSDLQQELNNVQIQLDKLQAEQKGLQKKQRRSQRYYNAKAATNRKSTVQAQDSSQSAETDVSIDELPSENDNDNQHSVVVAEILQSAENPNSDQHHNSTDDPNGGQTLFAIIPQQLTEGISTESSGAFQTIRSSLLTGSLTDQNALNTLFNRAGEEKSNALQNILGQMGIASHQLTSLSPQQLASQLISMTSEQTSLGQEQPQQYVEQSGMTVMEHLVTSSPASQLINQVSATTSHAAVSSLPDPSHIVQDQYIQQSGVPMMQEIIECETQER